LVENPQKVEEAKMRQYLEVAVFVALLSLGCGGRETDVRDPSSQTVDADPPAAADAPNQGEEAGAAAEPAQPETAEPSQTASPSQGEAEASSKAPADTAQTAPEKKTGEGKDEVKEAIEARITDRNIVISGKVLFETGNAKLKKVSHKVLDQVVVALEKHPEIIMLQIVGHTDSDGDAKANKRLSARRATAVMKYLIKRGIKKDRLSSVGVGEDMPIASNDTEEGKDKNRRVEFVIVERASVRAFTHTSSTTQPGNVDSRRATDDETEELIKKEGLDKKF
jgi:OmpA-OmpF porin, OOP family